jgi:hypothetical protein
VRVFAPHRPEYWDTRVSLQRAFNSRVGRLLNGESLAGLVTVYTRPTPFTIDVE